MLIYFEYDWILVFWDNFMSNENAIVNNVKTSSPLYETENY